MAKKPCLTLVQPGVTSADPPRKLDGPGRSLWNRVMSEYDIADSGGLEMLCQACQALDRAEALRDEIDRDGEVIRVRGSIREHPALKHELASRSFVVRALARLNLNFEPLQRELLAVAGWPHSRAAYEENLREAEEWRDYRVLLVRDPDARHQGTGMDEASLRERLKEAREEVAYRKKLLADLGAE